MCGLFCSTVLTISFTNFSFHSQFFLSGHSFTLLGGCDRAAFPKTILWILKGIFEKLCLNEQVSLGDTEFNQVKHASLHKISQGIQYAW